VLIALGKYENDALGVVVGSEVDGCRYEIEVDADRACDEHEAVVGVQAERKGGRNVVEARTGKGRFDRSQRGKTGDAGIGE
jgi:hypothetical protein